MSRENILLTRILTAVDDSKHSAMALRYAGAPCVYSRHAGHAVSCAEADAAHTILDEARAGSTEPS